MDERFQKAWKQIDRDIADEARRYHRNNAREILDRTHYYCYRHRNDYHAGNGISYEDWLREVAAQFILDCTQKSTYEVAGSGIQSLRERPVSSPRAPQPDPQIRFYLLAFVVLLQELRPLVEKQATRFMPRLRQLGYERDDLVQCALLHCWQQIQNGKRPRPGYSFRYWLLRVCSNKMLDIIGDRVREPDVSIDTTLYQIEGDSDLMNDVYRRYMQEVVDDALSALSPLRRKIFITKYLSGATAEEIAGIVELRPSQVNNMLFAIRRSLERWIRQHHPDLAEQMDSLNARGGGRPPGKRRER